MTAPERDYGHVSRSEGVDGDEVFLAWDLGEHHAEIEIFDDGRVEFFYRNRRTHYAFDVDVVKEPT